MHFKLYFTVLLAICATSKAANILGIFHYPSYSHQVVYQSLIKDLSERGHHLTILTVDQLKIKHPNITEIYLENSYNENINFVESRGFGNLKLFYELVMATYRRVDNQLSQPKVHDLIVNYKNYKFDLIILEYMFMTPMIAFGELFDCPVIGINAIGVGIPVHEVLGNPANPVIHSELIFPYQHGRMKFSERLSSFLYYIGTKFFLQPIFEKFFGRHLVIMSQRKKVYPF